MAERLIYLGTGITGGVAAHRRARRPPLRGRRWKPTSSDEEKEAALVGVGEMQIRMGFK